MNGSREGLFEMEGFGGGKAEFGDMGSGEGFGRKINYCRIYILKCERIKGFGWNWRRC